MVEHALVAPSSIRSRTSSKQHRRQFSRNRLPPDPAALLESATTAAAAATASDSGEQRRGHKKTASIASSIGSPGMFSALVALPPPEGSRRLGGRSIRAKGGRGSGGSDDKGQDNRLMPPGTARRDGGNGDGGRDDSGASSSLVLSNIQASYVEGFSTLSPMGSDGSMWSASGSDPEGVEPPSPGTLKQLEAVKAQLTDLLRALAVSFGQVGYCQGACAVYACLRTRVFRAVRGFC